MFSVPGCVRVAWNDDHVCAHGHVAEKRQVDASRHSIHVRSSIEASLRVKNKNKRKEKKRKKIL